MRLAYRRLPEPGVQLEQHEDVVDKNQKKRTDEAQRCHAVETMNSAPVESRMLNVLQMGQYDMGVGYPERNLTQKEPKDKKEC